MDAELRALLGQTIYVASVASRDSYGQATYGTPASRAARVETSSRVVKLATGEQLQTSHRIFVEAALYQEDRIWLPGLSSADATLARRPLLIEDIPDEDGAIDHYEVYV